MRYRNDIYKETAQDLILSRHSRAAAISLFFAVIITITEKHLIQNYEIFPNTEISSHGKYSVMLTLK